MVSDLLDVSFEIRKIRENLREEVEYLVSNIIINILRKTLGKLEIVALAD